MLDFDPEGIIAVKDRKSLRPCVTDLEARLTPSHVLFSTPVHEIPVPTVDVAYARTGIYQTSEQLAAQADFVALARSGEASGIVFLGDSLTEFWGGSRHPTAPGSPAWDADFVPLGAKNFGVFGDRTENLLWRIENGELDGRPKVAVLMIGINDLGIGRTPAQVAQNIETVVRAIRVESPSTKIILEGVLPNSSPVIGAGRLQVNARIAHTRGVTYVDSGSRMVAPDKGILPALTIDGLHLSAAGYQVLANALVGSVKAALGVGASGPTVTLKLAKVGLA